MERLEPRELLAAIPYTADADTVALFHLDEANGATTASDASVHGLDLTLTSTLSPFSGTVGPDGLSDAAGPFGATGDPIKELSRTIDNGEAALFNTSSFTIEAWVRNPTEVGHHVFQIRGGGVRFQLMVTSNRLRLTLDPGNVSEPSNILTFDPDTWYHVAVTYEQNGADGEVNFFQTRESDIGFGVINAGSATFVGFSPNAVVDGSSVLRVGGWDADNDRQFNGSIDEVRWSNGARSAEEMAPSDETPARFTEYATIRSGKLSWGDYNNDGFVDFVSSFVFRNENGVSFTDPSFNAGGGLWGDLNNDGWLDLYDGHALFFNNGGNGFTNETDKLPDIPNDLISRGAALADLNNDGYLDIYMGGYEVYSAGITFPDHIIIYNPDTQQYDISYQETVYRARGVTAADFDRDGDQDIYVSNYRLQPNRLWENDGNGNMTDVAGALGVAGTNNGGFYGHTIGSAWGDIDNDGWLDLFVGNFSHSPSSNDRAQFLRNPGAAGGPFQLMTIFDGDDRQESYSSPALGDYDNDGDLDLYITTVNSGDHPRLFRNDGNWNFKNVTEQVGLDDVGGTEQASFADFDNDGDLDLATGGRIYRNDASGKNWLKVRLEGDGTQVNRAAIGAQVRLFVGDETLTRPLEAGTGEGSQHDPSLHFGLGDHDSIVSLEVFWPNGSTQMLSVTPNQTIVIPYNLTALPEVEMGEVGQIVDLTDSVQTVILDRVYENPVVFAQSASLNGQQPVVVRVKNVQPDRFDMYLAEPSNEDGVHRAETVSYVVLEAGSHLLANGSKLEVGTVDTSATVGGRIGNLWEVVAFSTDFEATPVVLSQIQTKSASGQDYLQTRHLSTTNSSLTIGLEQEENITAQHPTETVGYLAIDVGAGTWNNMAYDARTTGTVVGEELTEITYANTFASTPSLLSSLTSYLGSDNAHLRYTAATASSVQFKVGEDTTYDTELNHTSEQVSYLAIGGQDVLTALDPQVEVGEVGTVTNLTDLPRVVTLDRSYENPVVFAQSVSGNGGAPTAVRVTNIQSDRFTMFLAEPSDKDGIHNAETVSYVVLEAGIHQLVDGTRVEVGTVDTSATVGRLVPNLWEPVDFSIPFAETPVVLSQIQTTNDAVVDYLKTRHLTTDADGFSFGLEPEEAVVTQLSTAETVGYLVMEGGSGNWGQFTYEAGYTSANVTDQWTDLSFSQFFTGAPAFLSSLSSYASQDNAGLRYQNLSGSGVQLKVDEDTTLDTEVVHLDETVGFLAIGGQGALLASRPLVDIGEVGRIEDLTNSPRLVELHGDYENPVVFAQSVSANGGQPVSVRVRNVQSNQFEIYLGEPSNEDGTHGAETVTYLVLEAGVHRLHDGTRLEVGTVNTSATVGKYISNVWENVNFSGSFAETPVVLSQIQTVAAGGARYLNTRYLSVSPSSISLALEPEEAATSPHVTETIGYLAIDAGTGVWSGLAFEAYATAAVVQDDYYDLGFGTFFNETPALLTNQSSYNGTDNSNLRYTNLTTSGVQVKVGEDTTFDTELTHGSESVAYFAIGGSGLVTAVMPLIPPQVTAFVRDYGDDAYDVLHTIQYTFDEDVTVTSAALQLTNDSSGGAAVDLSGAGFNYDASSQTATWDLSGLSPPLPAAWYTATLDATQVTDYSGLMLDGDGDGAAGDPYAHSVLVSRRGDTDLDGDVDITDFNTLAQNFDPQGLNGANGWSLADFDGDGDVDVRDFNSLTRNFSPLGYATQSALRASSAAGAVVGASATSDEDGLALDVALAESSSAGAADTVERAFADLDDANAELLGLSEFSYRRRLRRAIR